MDKLLANTTNTGLLLTDAKHTDANQKNIQLATLLSQMLTEDAN